MKKYVSVIIPVYKDWERLSLCLHALADQSYAKDLYEVLVVNNDPAGMMPADFFAPDNVRLLHERKLGSYAARNTAIKAAKGEIIGFTDSDCIPDQHWIRNAVDVFSNNNACTRIGGAINIFFQTDNPTKAELYDKIYAFNQKSYVTNSGTCVTANSFTYKYVFEEVGLFNDQLLSGGDFTWGVVAYQKGFEIEYAENVIVNHPARLSLSELIKKEKRVATGQAGFTQKNNSLIEFINLLNEVRPRLKEFRIVFSQQFLSPYNKVVILLIRHYLLGLRAIEKFKAQMFSPNQVVS